MIVSCHLQNCPAGLNFANEDEANQFKRAVQEKLQQRQQRKMGKLIIVEMILFCSLADYGLLAYWIQKES